MLTSCSIGDMTGIPATTTLSRMSSRGGRDGSALEGICSAVLPSEQGGPDAYQLAQQVAAFLDYQPTQVRLALLGAARALDGAALVTAGHRLVHLPWEKRVALLSRLESLPNGGQALAGLKGVVLLVHGAHAYAKETLAAARSTGLARPDADMDVTPSLAWPSFFKADAVVVGSGAGGAMVARTLARAGLETVIVEEGSRHSVEEFRSVHPLERFATLYRDGGSTVALGVPPVILPIGRGVGGTTLVNSGTCYRTPKSVLLRWRDEFGATLADPESFDPLLDDVEETFQVAPVPMEVMGRNGALLIEGASKLGWKTGPLRRNAPGCDGCCQCAIGCPRNAKFGVHLNALPQACQAGAKILSEAKVEHVILEGRRAVGILAFRPDGSKLEIRAPIVVLCAGATETPLLLRRSSLGKHPRIGRNLALHPALAAAGRFEERVLPWHGVLQSAGIEEFHESDSILIEATSTPPGMGSMAFPGLGKELMDQIRDADHLVTVGAMVGDEPAGRVHGSTKAVLSYSLTKRDASRLIKAIGIMAQALFAAGAKEVLTGIPGAMFIDSPDEIAPALEKARPKDLHLAAFHPTGTVAMGSDPARCPVDPSGCLRGVSGLWIADASVLPSCPEVNPQMSIMAMALGVAQVILASRA